jgi:MazG family protein
VIEEAHEVVDAIDRGDMAGLREELGDLLLQIVFQSALARAHFGLDDVIGAICDKMVRRHPHVFGGAEAADSQAVVKQWEAIKATEKRGRGVLEGVPVAMPALLRALRVSEKATHLGLDWPDERGVRDKVREELAELDHALAHESPERVSEELGDVLFSLVTLARKRGVDPEAALRGTVDRFSARVRHFERRARDEGVDPRRLSLVQLDRWWEETKEALRDPKD